MTETNQALEGFILIDFEVFYGFLGDLAGCYVSTVGQVAFELAEDLEGCGVFRRLRAASTAAYPVGEV